MNLWNNENILPVVAVGGWVEGCGCTRVGGEGGGGQWDKKYFLFIQEKNFAGARNETNFFLFFFFPFSWLVFVNYYTYIFYV